MKIPARSILAGLAAAAILTVSSAAIVTAASPVVAGGPRGKGVRATAGRRGFDATRGRIPGGSNPPPG